nr:ras-related protein RABC2a-like [Ipomoea batatas]
MGTRKESGCNSRYEYSFKILLIGDSSVGKSSLLLSFISHPYFSHHLSPTIGVDFKIRLLNVGDKRVKFTIWDTAGQERFGTLISSYYRGAHGIILVYDVTRPETFANLTKIWAKEIERYCTNQDCIKILVANKVDRDDERVVATSEGMAFAREHKCIFYECSAKTSLNVQQCFQELTLKILEVPSLLEKGSAVVKNHILKEKHDCQAQQYNKSNCCS